MTAKTITVTNSTELLAALKTATGGEKIELAAGDYGALNITKYANAMHNTSNVTIESADPAHQAVFTGVNIGQQSNLTINDVKVEVPFDGKNALTGVSIGDSSHVAFTNSTVTGQLVTASQQDLKADFGLGFIAGTGVGTGVSVRNSSDVTVANNEVSQFMTGSGFMNTTNLTISHNDLSGMRADVMDLAQVTNTLVQGNYFHDQKPAPDALEMIHRDNIQMWTTNTTVPSSNVTIDSNVIVNTANSYRQSIFMGNEIANGGNPSYTYKNITVTNNLIYGNQLHGTSISYVDGLKVANNTYIASTDLLAASAPGINIGHASNVVVENNVVTPSGVSINSSTNVTNENNYITQRADQSADNFVGKLFVDALSGYHASFTQGDLTAVANGYLVQNHLGSSLTWSPVGMTAPALYVKVDYGTGLDKQTIAYTAATIFKTNVDLTGATIKLDFGDGTTSTSFNGSHTYAKPGDYQVTGTITLANGQVITGSEGVSVHDPKVLDIDFTKGFVDNSYLVNELNPQHVSLVKTDLGQSMHMDTTKSFLGLGRTADTAGNEAMTISIAFKKDHATDAGTLFQQVGTGAISLDASGKLVVSMMDNDKHNFTQKDTVTVADTNWHLVTVTFDGAKGVANYYMDGTLVGTQTGFTAGQVTGNWEPTLGTPWGTSLTAAYDNVQYLSGALSAAQVQAGWAALQAQLHPVATPVGTPDPVGTGGDGAGSVGSNDEATVMAQTVNAYLAAHHDATTVNGVAGNIYVNTAAPDTIIHASASTTNIVSNSATGDDLVYGNDKGDFYWSRGGNDTFIGGAGNDTVWNAHAAFGGAGNDYLNGTAGNDVLYGDAGDDKLMGRGGTDKMYGGDGNDSIYSSNDGVGSVLSGGAGNDYLEAHGKGDILLGGAGDDKLVAYGIGGDYLDGGAGRDQINGSNGNDTIVYDANDSVIMGYKGFDTLLVSANNGDLDFSKIGRFGGIDKVEMTNGTAEKLTLHYSDIMQSDNHTLFITGDAKDSVQLAVGVNLQQVGSSAVAGSADNLSAGHTFVHYSGTSGGTRLDLFVESDIHVITSANASSHG